MHFWDQQFGGNGFKYGTQPNRFLQSRVQSIAPGAHVLVPGDGEGRNGVWLAEQGFTVLSVDGSSVGLAKARRLAAQRHVQLDTLQADLCDWTPEPASVDAVVLTYVHLLPVQRRAMHQRMAQALRPNGVLLLECFHPQQLGRASGGPRQLDMLCALADLQQDFEGLLMQEWGVETQVDLDEGPGHQGLAAVTRYQGRRLPVAG